MMTSSTISLLDAFEDEITRIVKNAVESALLHLQESQTRYPETVSVEQASEMTGYSKASIYQMHSKGTIPGAIKLGGKLRFDTATLQGWIKNDGIIN